MVDLGGLYEGITCFVGYWGLERLDYLSSLCICPLKLDFVMLSILALDN
jgi:hypothetical protein